MTYNFLKSIILLLIFFVLGIHGVVAQTNDFVIIGCDDAGYKAIREKAENIGLLIHNEGGEANTRGLLIPRMSYNNMQAIKEPKDGLLVYVTDVDTQGELDLRAEGFWYWDQIPNIWRRLKIEENRNDCTEPVGTIVAFRGNVVELFDGTGLGITGTEAEGWALCDGQAGRPNLKERFIVGKKDGGSGSDNTYGGTGGQNTYIVEEEQIPTHAHVPKGKIVVNNVGHSHAMDDLQHNHTYEATWGYESKEKIARAVDGSDGGYHEFLTEGENSGKVRFSMGDLVVNLTFPNENIVENYGIKTDNTVFPIIAPEPIDNRPEFYELIFIIKLN